MTASRMADLQHRRDRSHGDPERITRDPSVATPNTGGLLARDGRSSVIPGPAPVRPALIEVDDSRRERLTHRPPGTSRTPPLRT
jgi:hypothetical protein